MHGYISSLQRLMAFCK